ncbi:MAG: phosphodiesterase [Ilumatobacteraceae bacterium]|nr:phosphodiesterase [Ilumatobacteraceae bacterium]
MAELILGPMLRYVDETSATVWMETDAACTVQVLDRETHTFTVAGHHYALVVLDALEPAGAYPYDVTLDGVVRWPEAGSSLPASVVFFQDMGNGSVRS